MSTEIEALENFYAAINRNDLRVKAPAPCLRLSRRW